MAFSGALTITDLDDFLTPSQACIIPVRNTKPLSGSVNENTEIQIDSNNNYYEVQTHAGPSSGSSVGVEKQALKKAEISLNDCLACSGCITSTESLLITMQSHSEVLKFIQDPTTSAGRTPVLSISPQTLASLSASYSTSSSTPPIPLITLLRRIRTFLSQPQNGGWRVWDTTFARELSLRETLAEFRERQTYSKAEGKQVDRSTPAPGPLPMLASACPGWVCYAEKAQGDLLPLLSSVRSSQAIIGGLVKSWWAQRMDLNPAEVYHVTAMPCYDKKLEASRSDFYSSVYSTRDVDCVLTTGELDLVLQELGFDPHLPVSGEDWSSPFDIPDRLSSPWPELISHPGTSSGSYLHTLLSQISQTHPNPTKLHVKEIRSSSDNVEYLLEDLTTNEIIFKGLKTYGFRNLQNLVRKVGKETGIGRAVGGKGGRLSAAVAARRRKKVVGGTDTPTTDGSDVESISARLNADDKKIDFVEVMACPGGCVNGGGQLKPVTPGSGLKETDEEGYERPLADDGTDVGTSPNEAKVRTGVEGVEKVDEGMRWSTKEWVEKVENIYWMGYPTPPPSPKPDVQLLESNTSGPNGVDLSHAAETSRRAVVDAADIDGMVDTILKEVAGDNEVNRWEFLRTRFRRVEGDVLGGGISLEAVKW